MKSIFCKKLLFSVFVLGIVVLLYSLVSNLVNFRIRSKIVNDLAGEVYYTKRIDGILTLFKSDSNMKNEKLIFSNKGNGIFESGGQNDNIIDFRYFPETGQIEFEAVYGGKFSILGIKEGESTPSYVREAKEFKVLDDYRVVEMDTDYISCKNGKIEVFEKKGALYLKKDGQVKCIKRFIGMYSEKFTGYRPIGLSPDGKYLVYSDLGRILGVLVSEKKQYIMDLQTGKSTKYIHFSSDIQWVQK